MRKFVTACSRSTAVFALFVLLAAAVFAQTGPGTGSLRLRQALDFDADGKADYPVFRPGDSNWYIFKTGGGVTIQNWGIPNDDFFTPGDYDGDGKGDISVFRDSTGVWYRLNSSTNTVTIVQWGTTGDEAVARDYDGDGKTDIAIARRTGGNMIWYVFRSSDSQAMVVGWGLSTDYTAPGDYDGDGKFDFCIQRPGPTPTSTATFYAYLSNGGINITNWGQSNDIVVPGDYDGDGKTDFAVIREGATPSTPLRWFIYNSGSGTASVFDWGITETDQNAQNDYDGDGKTDATIWRDTTGEFWILKSTGGNTVVHWGVPNDFPVAGYDTH
jgi:hypothetical protein